MLYKNLGINVATKSFIPDAVNIANTESNISPLYPPNTISLTPDPINAAINATTTPIITIDIGLNFIFLNINPATNPTATLTIINGENEKFPINIGAIKFVNIEKRK